MRILGAVKALVFVRRWKVVVGCLFLLLCGHRVVSVRALGHFKVSGGSEGARVACPPPREPPLSVLGASKWEMAVYGSRVRRSRVKLPARRQGSLPSRLVSPRPKWRRARDKEPAPGGEGTGDKGESVSRRVAPGWSARCSSVIPKAAGETGCTRGESWQVFSVQRSVFLTIRKT